MARDRGFQKKIQTTHWTGFNAAALALTSGGTAGVLMSAAQHLPETILRTRGQFFVGLDAVGAPGRIMRYGIGFAQVPEGTGSTVLWSPLADTDAPWFWYQTGIVSYEESVTDVIQIGGGFDRGVIDSKAMRIVRNRELQCVFETSVLDGSSATNLFVAGRFLSGS